MHKRGLKQCSVYYAALKSSDLITLQVLRGPRIQNAAHMRLVNAASVPTSLRKENLQYFYRTLRESMQAAWYRRLSSIRVACVQVDAEIMTDADGLELGAKYSCPANPDGEL